MRVLPRVLACLAACPALLACTNILVTKGASRTGATLLAYTDDSVTRYGDLAFRPRMTHVAGAQREVVNWSTGVFHGRIPEPALTYQRIGNMNEHQLCIRCRYIEDEIWQPWSQHSMHEFAFWTMLHHLTEPWIRC